ncbi:MAG: DUF6089 family protein [Saprospiraceae bacterium]|nr:DUF6089 family protein [Saprospiraceae bacterium]
MQRTFIILCLCFSATLGFSQAGYQPMYPLEIGLQVGTSQFLGDLGGQKGIGRPFLRDTDFGQIRPTVGIYGRYNVGAHFAARVDLSFLQVSGNDADAGTGFSPETKGSDGAWFRYYRNLSFRSNIFEAAVAAEVIPYNFELGGGYSGYSVLSPYGFIGIGVFNFRPQALYNGVWTDLHPLRTEGQGFIDGRAPYSLTQMNIPLGLGIKWTYNDTWSISLEVNHRITFTDYIDDVSTDYVDPQVFLDNFPEDRAQIAIDLARRSVELDPGEVHGYVTAPNEQRGDPKDNDSYYTINVRFSYHIDPRSVGSGRRYGCPVW